MSLLKSVTFITITYNDVNLYKTINSYETILSFGGSLIIVNGGEKLPNNLIRNLKNKNVSLIQEKDNGRYDAINKGIKLVVSKYFILVHGGDRWLLNNNSLEELLNLMDNEDLDIILGNQYIPFHGKLRKHKVDLWKPWMFNFGAQPPHMPIIYKTKFVNKFNYNSKSNIITDFVYLKNIFKNKPNYKKSNKFHVYMEEGGATSTGFRSFFYVSKEFIKEFGFFKGFIMALARLPIKIIQAI